MCERIVYQSTASQEFRSLALFRLLADLHGARQQEQLGRLALLAFCDVKRWARQAGKTDVADMALRMFAEKPCLSKEDFLHGIDHLITALQWHAHGHLHAHQGSGSGYAASSAMACETAIAY